MQIPFTKMHGLGNDFMVIDGVSRAITLTPNQIAALSDRHTGIGFDQCLLIEASPDPTIDFFYRIFNANGQEVGQCGNGARCLARFVAQHGLTTKKDITIATHTTRMQLHLNPDDTVTVNLGLPRLDPVDIPLQVATQTALYTLPLSPTETCLIHALSIGNPHAILVVPDLTLAPVSSLGQMISEHPLFPEQTNVGFLQICSPSHIRLRVYERGCGETLACGSGAAAAVVAGRLFHQLAENVTVSLPGGDLFISWPQMEGPLFLTGPAVFVYEGTVLSSFKASIVYATTTTAQDGLE